MISNINQVKKDLSNLVLHLRARFQFEIRKIFRIRLRISLDRQALPEYEMELMMPIYK